MSIHYQDDWLTVYAGDCREQMRTMPENSIHTCVTSPPYWGLRDYGTATWAGGHPSCDHLKHRQPRTNRPKGLLGGGLEYVAAQEPTYRDHCGKCGAIREDQQLGLEPTPEQYVANMVDVFREVRRVLRDDGTLWLNLGDSYGAAKQLVGIPWRVAFALQVDGWYLRSDIIWAKPNPMPESVTDRPTKSHEYLFLLAKAERYYFDADAVREPHQESTLKRVEYGLTHRHPDGVGVGIPPVDTERMGERFANPAGRNIRSVWTIATQAYAGAHFATFPEKLVEPCIKAGSPEGGVVLDPFGGSGTTAMVAQSLSRKAVLVELNPSYIGQALTRNTEVPLGL